MTSVFFYWKQYLDIMGPKLIFLYIINILKVFVTYRYCLVLLGNEQKVIIYYHNTNINRVYILQF